MSQIPCLVEERLHITNKQCRPLIMFPRQQLICFIKNIGLEPGLDLAYLSSVTLGMFHPKRGTKVGPD